MNTDKEESFKLEQHGDRLMFVRFVSKTYNQEHKFLLMSDIHIDSRKCDRALLKKHLDQAKAEGAGVFIFGDLFDAMQGKYDPRSAKNAAVCWMRWKPSPVCIAKA